MASTVARAMRTFITVQPTFRGDRHFQSATAPTDFPRETGKEIIGVAVMAAYARGRAERL